MKCYICNKDLRPKGLVTNEASETETHVEHIIQNALRGKLSSDSILCSKCGNELNETIDSAFVKYFSPITEQLNDFMIRKDHGQNNAGTPVWGQLLLSEYPEMDVTYKEGIVTSHKPIHQINFAEKKATIFANEKIIKDYQKKVEAEINAKGLDPADFKFTKITNITDGVFLPYFGKGVVDLDKTISLGFIKIAVEFALQSGIKREDINRALTFKEDGTAEILLDRNVISYFPQGSVDSLYEYYKPLLEPNYPTHTLILFTHERRSGRHVLYCYIELFSTYQVYIILNHSYETPFYKSFYQSVLKEEVLSGKDSRDLSATLREIHQRFEKIYFKDGDLDEIEKNINQGIEDISEGLKKTLEAELEAIDNVILNQNMDKPDFEDMTTYDLTVSYKRYFHNQFSEECESLPAFLIQASRFADDDMVTHIQNYTTGKISRLLQSIMILQNLGAE